MINPADDGVTHINIYSKGNTTLGRTLSNFAKTPFHCEDGHFESIEGYWYWLSCKNDELRKLYGYLAKKRGRELRGTDWPSDVGFKVKILNALQYKLDQNIFIQDLLKKSELPFEHYYVFGDKIYDERSRNLWIIDFWETKRKELKDE